MKATTKIEIKDLVNKTPKEIVEFFQAKGYTFSWNWQDTWQECHTKAFTVAKVMEMDILTDIRKEIENAIENGITLEQFKNNLEPVLAKKGWWQKKKVVNDENGLEVEVELGSNRRMKTIYETNLTTSYRAGQYKQQWENRESRPNWMYVCKMLPTSREEHKALNGKVFPADDPFWDAFYPPNGWGCKCDVIPLTDEELESLSTYKFEPKLDKDGNQIVINGIPQFQRVKSPIQICQTDANSLQINEETVISDGVPLTYKTTSYIEPTTGQRTTTGLGWNYNVGKATYYEPDLSKYDDEFVKLYKRMKESFCLRKMAQEFFTTGKSLGAMAKRFYVDVPKKVKTLDGDDWYLVEGSTVTGVKVIAEGEEIREVNRLIKEYPLPNNSLTKAKDWCKVRATAQITNGKITVRVEVHYYFCKTIGKVEFKKK